LGTGNKKTPQIGVLRPIWSVLCYFFKIKKRPNQGCYQPHLGLLLANVSRIGKFDVANIADLSSDFFQLPKRHIAKTALGRQLWASYPLAKSADTITTIITNSLLPCLGNHYGHEINWLGLQIAGLPQPTSFFSCKVTGRFWEAISFQAQQDYLARLPFSLFRRAFLRIAVF